MEIHRLILGTGKKYNQCLHLSLLARGTKLSKTFFRNLLPSSFLDIVSAFSSFHIVTIPLCVTVWATYAIHKDVLQAGQTQL